MNLPVATIKAVDEEVEFAQVTLDGYRAVDRPKQWGYSAETILQWKFAVLDGDFDWLEEAHGAGEQLMLRTEQGTEVIVKIIKIPSAENEKGIIQYTT